MKRVAIFILISMLTLGAFHTNLFALKKKVAQSGMTYLAISLGARESAMGDASVASVRGIQGTFYNTAVLADISKFSFCIDQVSWLVDTKVYGLAAAYSLGGIGTIGLDLVYMDYGEIMGTKAVDKSVDYRGFITTGDIGVEEYALGFSFAHRVSDRFAFGIHVKKLHENLGNAEIAVKQDPNTEQVTEYKMETWKLNHWGMDVSTMYFTGYKNLAFAMSMQNFSTDMKYWYEEFQLPMALRMGLSMDVSQIFMPANENFQLNMAIDAIHPNDFLERVQIGTELVYLKRFALRGGYKFNHDVETFTLGVGMEFSFAGLETRFDFAYTNANYFKDVNRFSLQFSF